MPTPLSQSVKAPYLFPRALAQRMDMDQGHLTQLAFLIERFRFSIFKDISQCLRALWLFGFVVGSCLGISRTAILFEIYMSSRWLNRDFKSSIMRLELFIITTAVKWEKLEVFYCILYWQRRCNWSAPGRWLSLV